MNEKNLKQILKNEGYKFCMSDYGVLLYNDEKKFKILVSNNMITHYIKEKVNFETVEERNLDYYDHVNPMVALHFPNSMDPNLHVDINGNEIKVRDRKDDDALLDDVSISYEYYFGICMIYKKEFISSNIYRVKTCVVDLKRNEVVDKENFYNYLENNDFVNNESQSNILEKIKFFSDFSIDGPLISSLGYKITELVYDESLFEEYHDKLDELIIEINKWTKNYNFHCTKENKTWFDNFDRILEDDNLNDFLNIEIECDCYINWCPVLNFIIKNDARKIFDYCISKIDNINIQDVYGSSLLFSSLYPKNNYYLKKLLENNIDYDLLDEYRNHIINAFEFGYETERTEEEKKEAITIIKNFIDAES